MGGLEQISIIGQEPLPVFRWALVMDDITRCHALVLTHLTPPGPDTIEMH